MNKNEMVAQFKVFYVRKRKGRGFTLVELLLALTIFAIVAATVYNTFASGLKLQERSSGRHKIYQEARWAMSVMARDLEQLIQYDFSRSYPELKSFVGSSDKWQGIVPSAQGLTLVRYHLQELPQGSVYQTIVGEKYSGNKTVVVSLREEAQRPQMLIREESPLVDYFRGVSASAESQSDVLCAHIKEGSLKFYYPYAADEEAARIEWKQEWPSDSIPQAVRVEWTFLPSEKHQEPFTLNRVIHIPTGVLGKEKL